MVKAYGSEFKRTLVYDRIKEDLRIFCANNTIDDVYNVKFLDIVEQVKANVKTSISRLGEVVTSLPYINQCFLATWISIWIFDFLGWNRDLEPGHPQAWDPPRYRS